jgi:hypothetical protein
MKKDTIMSKLISLETAQAHYYPKPERTPIQYADAFTLVSDENNPLTSYVNYWLKHTSFDAQLSFNEGYIYILENKGQPGILKIGYTDRTPQQRVKEINGGTGVITPWIIVEAFACRAPGTIETAVHQQLKSYHVNKEGFAVGANDAVDVILRVIRENNANL